MLLKNTHAGVQMTYSQILNLTSTMSIEEMCSLNRELVGLIKHRQKMEAKDMRQALSVGDTVKFTERNGMITKGRVTKIMRTRALVDIGVATYKVPMSMLSLA